MYNVGDVVWARSNTINDQMGGIFWPAMVIDDPRLITKDNPAIACVTFLASSERRAITLTQDIYPFDCHQKQYFITKGRCLQNTSLKLLFNTALMKVEHQLTEESQHDFDTTTACGQSIEQNNIDQININTTKSICNMINDVVDQQHDIVKDKVGTTVCKSNLIMDEQPNNQCSIVQNNIETISSLPKSNVNLDEEDYNSCGSTKDNDNATSRLIFNEATIMNDDNQNNIETKSNNDTDQRDKDQSCIQNDTNSPTILCTNNTLNTGENCGEETSSCNENRPESVCPANLQTTTEKKGRRGRKEDKKVDEQIPRRSGRKRKAKTLHPDTIVMKRKPRTKRTIRKKTNETTTAVDNFSSDNEDSLPEAFTPTRKSLNDFQEGDIVWAKYPRSNYWPARIIRKDHRRSKTFYVHFINGNNQRMSWKMRFDRMKSFTCDAMQRFKNQSIPSNELADFKEAIKQAESILMKRANGKNEDSVLMNDKDGEEYATSADEENITPSVINCKEEVVTSDEGCNSMCSCDSSDEETKPCFTELSSCVNSGNLSDNEESSCSCDEETVSSNVVQLPLLAASPVRKTNVELEFVESSIYDEILSDFHSCKKLLLSIFRGQTPSSRHKKFYTSVSQRNSLKHESGFGPIEDEDLRDKVIDILKSWYGEVKGTFIQLDYIFDVWLPEAMIFFIQKYENVSREEAEHFLLDNSRFNHDKKNPWFKRKNRTETSRKETLRHTRSLFHLSKDREKNMK